MIAPEWDQLRNHPLRFSSDADIVRLTNARIIIIEYGTAFTFYRFSVLL